MGLALAIIMVGIVGLSQQEALHHKHVDQAQASPNQIKKKTIKREDNQPKNSVVLLDDVEIRNLQG